MRLQALRRVDRYGITARGEQYAGWKALPGRTHEPMDEPTALRVVSDLAGLAVDEVRADVPKAIRSALFTAHPDHGGTDEQMVALNEAREVLRRVTNPSKAKGTRWEVRVRDHFREHGAPHCERLAQGGTLDRGDLTGLPGVVIECKARKGVALAEWQDELRVEMRNANATVGAVLVPRRNHQVGDGYAVVPIDVFTLLLQQAGWIPEPT